jgi:hypothetical protein
VDSRDEKGEVDPASFMPSLTSLHGLDFKLKDYWICVLELYYLLKDSNKYYQGR